MFVCDSERGFSSAPEVYMGYLGAGGKMNMVPSVLGVLYGAWERETDVDKKGLVVRRKSKRRRDEARSVQSYV